MGGASVGQVPPPQPVLAAGHPLGAVGVVGSGLLPTSAVSFNPGNCLGAGHLQYGGISPQLAWKHTNERGAELGAASADDVFFLEFYNV